MHSGPKSYFPYELLEGLYSRGTIHTNIYIRQEMPLDNELRSYSSSFLIVASEKGPEVYYVDQTGQAEKAELQKNMQDKFNKTIKSEVAKLNASDFYVIPRSMAESNDDVLEIISASNSDIKSAFVLHGVNLYYVNKLNGDVDFIQRFDKNDLGLVSKELMENANNGKISQSRLNGRDREILVGMLDKNKRNIVSPIHINTPIDMLISKESFQIVKSALNQHFAQGEKQLYLYEAEVDADLYPSNKGDFISKNFETVKEMNDKNAKETVSELLDETFDKKRMVERVELGVREIKRKVKDPIFWTQVATKLVAAGSHHAKTDPYYRQEQMLANLKEKQRYQHNRDVVIPRSDRAYALSRDISMNEMQGSKLDHEFNQGGNPFNIMKVWVVSDIEPGVVASRCGISNELGHSFVCATEEDALRLAKKIGQSSKDGDALMTAKALHFELYNGERDHDKNIGNSINMLYSMLDKHMSAYNVLMRRQGEYIADYNKISEHDKAAPIPVEMGKRNDIMPNEYTHFQQMKAIQGQMLMVYQVINECEKALSKIDIKMLNKEIENLHQQCKIYIEQHPYKDKDTDPIFQLMSNLERVKSSVSQAMRLDQDPPGANMGPPADAPTARNKAR